MIQLFRYHFAQIHQDQGSQGAQLVCLRGVHDMVKSMTTRSTRPSHTGTAQADHRFLESRAKGSVPQTPRKHQKQLFRKSMATMLMRASYMEARF